MEHLRDDQGKIITPSLGEYKNPLRRRPNG
jgi:hypothetical protein